MIVPLFIVASLLAACHGADFQTFPLRMKTTGLGIHYPPEVSCASKRLAVEAHNIREFKTVPLKCQEYVAKYLLSDQYQSDSKTVCVQAYYHVRDLNIDHKKDIFIIGVDDASLSSLPYYKTNGFGVKPYNDTLWTEWVESGNAPALPETRKLYGKLLSLGIKIVFLSSRSDAHKDATAANLRRAGFHTWEKLITRSSEYGDISELEYKTAERQKLVDEGYRIIGNIGDQWSDLLGENAGERTFKLPNPIYYVI